MNESYGKLKSEDSSFSCATCEIRNPRSHQESGKITRFKNLPKALSSLYPIMVLCAFMLLSVAGSTLGFYVYQRQK
ncbi:CLUMA_CG012421, isoform A [Clunio marinus]|uniref:CLUMA_CG012421, isoform A n=1 Tax=Clunio marinus TaxID=568069 RepID=A0A1J1IG41_9DIPT|nr:CLUMA_CG012421, isoform A [Clunio marinus]